MNYQNLITIEPGKLGGKPCIRGMRITVYDVLDYLATGMSEAEIMEDFPDLTHDDIRACLAFAADLENDPFIGLWKGRENFANSTYWVRALREKEWTR